MSIKRCTQHVKSNCFERLVEYVQVNFGGLETVPLEFQHRNLFVHNDQVRAVEFIYSVYLESGRQFRSLKSFVLLAWTCLLDPTSD